MKEHDAYYTPEALADKLIAFISEEKITSAVDFCVGDGKLLDAVARRFPKIKCFGNDISIAAIEDLQKTREHWILSNCDFRDEEKFNTLVGIGNREYDLIVLNPPFTCKGSSICKVEFEGVAYHVSTAMQFIVRALKYRSKHGVLYAILPSSCAYSQKDRRLWTHLVEHHNLQLLEDSNRMYWSSCSASIIMVSIGSKVKRPKFDILDKFDFTVLPIIKALRGRIAKHDANFTEGQKGVKYIHTTNLQGGKIMHVSRINVSTSYQVQGPAVLIPRVCNPNQGKICVYNGNTKFVPSDCVIALMAKTDEDAMIIANSIIEHWKLFVGIYQGTAAKYTTMERIHSLFCCK